MTIDQDIVDELEAEQLIVNGRYRIHPADGGKPKLYTRATTWADMLEDSAQLRDWRCRKVAIGLGLRPDLLALIQATPVEDKDSLNVYCEQAFRAAGGDDRANWGSAAHGFVARILRGETLDVPPSLVADVEAAVACLKRHELVPMIDMIEQVLVCELLGVAGRDDIVCINADGEMFITDLKTGDRLVEYGALKTAMQLSIYANADTVYDPDTHTHRPMPAVSKDVAYVIHRPLGSDECTLLKVDIKAGWKYASELVRDVKDARNHGKRKGDSMFSVVPEPTESQPHHETSAAEELAAVYADELERCVECGGEIQYIECPTGSWWAHVVHPNDDHDAEPSPPHDLRAWVLGRLEALKHNQHGGAAQAMKDRWPEHIPGFKGAHVHTETELRALAMILDVVEAHFEVSFGESDPTIDRTPTVVEETPPAPGIDEGRHAGADLIERILAKVDGLDPEKRAIVNVWARTAHEVGHGFSIKSIGSERRYWIYRAVLDLADLIDPDGDQDMVRATVAVVIPDAAQPAIPIGVALGQLTIAEAEHLAELARCIAADPPALAYEPDTGAVRWDSRF